MHQYNELIQEIDSPIYPSAEAGRLVNLSTTRVSRWLKGYDYQYDSQVRHQQAVIRRQGTEGTSYASFLDLVDLLFVKQFLDYGVSLQKVRKALDEAVIILNTHHFARQCFFTDGNNIFVKMKEQGDAILQLLSGGQWVIASMIQKLASQIDFDATTGLALRWFPMGHKGLVVLDPIISFGRPSLINSRITTANVFDLFNAEKKKIKRVCNWMNIPPKEVEAAIRFEKQLVA